MLTQRDRGWVVDLDEQHTCEGCNADVEYLTAVCPKCKPSVLRAERDEARKALHEAEDGLEHPEGEWSAGYGYAREQEGALLKEASRLIAEMAHLIGQACPDADIWQDGLADEVDAFEAAIEDRESNG